MSKTPRSVAVYARISSDQEGAGLGVARQVQDCRALADSLGWEVGEEYVDNDLSAYTGRKPRPGYQRMLADLADGTRDAVVAYHVDRLTRRPIELEQFVETVTAAGLRHVRFVSGGDLDLGNGDGLLVVRMLAAVAANESASKSRRVRRKYDEIAASGRPHYGRYRPFGYEEDRVTIRLSEADIIRQLVARFVAGESLRSLCTWLEDNDVPTVSGAPWRTPTLRQMLASPRIAGLRSHRGQVVGKGLWEPIITEDDRAQVLAMLDTKRTSGRRAPRRYVLSGLLRCGRCGTTLYSSARTDRRRYVCLSGPDHGGCGKLTVVAPPVEDLITDAVLFRLDTPELADALAGRASNDEAQRALADELAADRRQLEELARLYADKAITAAEWMTARNPIEARIAAGTRRLAHHSGSQALAGLVGNGDALRTQWDSLALTRQHAIVAAVLDHALIAPGQPGARIVDPNRVRPLWRL